MTEDKARDEGFAIFKNGALRRLSPTHYVAKSQEGDGWRLMELKEGKWICDCVVDGTTCAHLYAALFHRYASKECKEDLDEAHLKCRYCGSIDIAGCGFRYGARGISCRYLCRDCQRKFSIPYVHASVNNKPNELSWLLNEVGMLITRLTQLVSEMNEKLDVAHPS